MASHSSPQGALLMSRLAVTLFMLFYAVAVYRAVYAVYAISSLDTGLPLRLRSRIAVGTHQGVAGLAPRPFTLGEETGSHLRPSPPSPPPSVAAVGRRRRPTPAVYAVYAISSLDTS